MEDGKKEGEAGGTSGSGRWLGGRRGNRNIR